MTAPRSEVVRELLELERAYAVGGLDMNQSERWNVLVSEVFGEKNAEHGRRSFRLPTEVTAKVKIRDGVFDCRLFEISLLGLSVSNQAFHVAISGEAAELLTVEVGGENRSIGLLCDIVRVESSAQPPIVGLKIGIDNSPSVRQRFFNDVYYPLYLSYLESLI